MLKYFSVHLPVNTVNYAGRAAIIQAPSDMNTTQGQAVTFTCTAASITNGNYTIIWSVDGTQIQETNAVTSDLTVHTSLLPVGMSTVRCLLSQAITANCDNTQFDGTTTALGEAVLSILDGIQSMVFYV